MRSPNVILAGLCAGALATGGLLWLWSDQDSGPPSGGPTPTPRALTPHTNRACCLAVSFVSLPATPFAAALGPGAPTEA